MALSNSRGNNSRCPWRISRAYPPTDQPSRGASQPSPAVPSAPYGKVRHEISAVDLSTATVEDNDLRVSGCKTVASYNWVTKPEASIVVPGLPAKWTPLLTPKQLSEDCGTFYRDRNAAFYPKHPLEPAVRSILSVRADMKPTESFGTVDLFGCGSTLASLLRFSQGKAPSFRILVEVVGSVVHLVRRERSPRETIPDVRGYGHSFPESYTTWDPEVRGSSFHQRIVNYQLGGLGIFCLFEGDGYLPSELTLPTEPAPKETIVRGSTSSADEGAFSCLSVSSSMPSSTNNPGGRSDGEPELKVSVAGQLKPQNSIFELKTRSIKRQNEQDAIMQPQLSRLWLRQVPNLVLAYHTSGLFTDIRVMDIRNEVSEWEKKESAVIRKFVALLRQIVDIARSGLASGCRMELTCEEGASILCVRDQEPDLPQFLSQETLKKWEAWLNEDDTSHSDVDDSESWCLTDDYSFDHNSTSEGEDFAACDKECGYCGRCEY
ncbi:hypothetical protein E4U24_001354 [Claviceps purpurea]|nr:hypothetical protein E4U36_006883 [Claviceps purpurea]KAG6251185.1 hypothetical protein E4U24_001354 [Claviceps purpurea]KAG6254238.1 hypothetical protein E4U23_006609 [Claviceps purpurea]